MYCHRLAIAKVVILVLHVLRPVDKGLGVFAIKKPPEGGCLIELCGGLALRELRSLTGFFETWLHTFFFTRIAGQKAGLLESRAQIFAHYI
jgi:hypothetical protein